MVQWLAVGPEFNVHSELRYDIVDWTNNYNIKDYRSVFFDLEHIFENPSEYYHPSSSSSQAIVFPDSEAVARHTRYRNDIFVRLPPEIEVHIPTPDGDAEVVDLLNWLPFKVHTDSSETGETVSLPSNPFPRSESTSQRNWRWYFTPPEFSWEMRIMGISPWPGEQPEYSHSVLRDLEEEISNLATRDGSPSEGKLSRIALTNADELIAAKVVLKDTHEYSGNIYLLPSRQKPFSEFVVDILHNWYDFDASIVRTDPSPLWAEEVSIVGEDDLSGQISELEAEAARLKEEVAKRTEYKQLIYTRGPSLEDLVRDAFREFGFTVEGEEPGKWDGVIQFDDCEYILEVTGTGGGVSEGKLSQLDRHRRNYESDQVPPEEVYTLLVANTFMQEHPANREVHKENFIDSIEGTNKRVMTTKTLYNLLDMYYGGEISGDNVQQLLRNSEALIQYKQDDRLWEQPETSRDLTDRISTLLNKVTHGFL